MRKFLLIGVVWLTFLMPNQVWARTEAESAIIAELKRITSVGGGGGGGDASAAKQDTGNASLASIDGKIPASPATATRQPAVAPSEGAGVVDTGTQRVVLASDGPTVTVLGGTTDSAVGDATGSINAHVRQVAKVLTDGTQQTKVTSSVGTANIAISQVTATTTPATLVIARATRRKVTILNTDAAITVYYGPSSPTLTSSTGFPLKAGQSKDVPWVGLIQIISASGTPVVAAEDDYD